MFGRPLSLPTSNSAKAQMCRNFVVSHTRGTLQKVKQFEVDNFMENLINFPLASALMARINRQNEPLNNVKINGVHLSANTGIIATLFTKY